MQRMHNGHVSLERIGPLRSPQRHHAPRACAEQQPDRPRVRACVSCLLQRVSGASGKVATCHDCRCRACRSRGAAAPAGDNQPTSLCACGRRRRRGGPVAGACAGRPGPRVRGGAAAAGAAAHPDSLPAAARPEGAKAGGGGARKRCACLARLRCQDPAPGSARQACTRLCPPAAGLRLFLMEDHEVPIVRASLLIRGGMRASPPDKVRPASAAQRPVLAAQLAARLACGAAAPRVVQDQPVTSSLLGQQLACALYVLFPHAWVRREARGAPQSHPSFLSLTYSSEG